MSVEYHYSHKLEIQDLFLQYSALILILIRVTKILNNLIKCYFALKFNHFLLFALLDIVASLNDFISTIYQSMGARANSITLSPKHNEGSDENSGRIEMGCCWTGFIRFHFYTSNFAARFFFLF